MIAQHLLLAIDFKGAIRDLHSTPPRILVIGHEQLGWRSDRRIVPERKLKDPLVEIKRHAQRFPCHCASIRPYDRWQCPPTRMDVLRIRLLVATKDRKILAIPLIAMYVCVVGGIVPKRATQQRILQCPQAPIHRSNLLAKIAGAVGLLVLEIEWNAKLAEQHRRATKQLERLLFVCG